MPKFVAPSRRQFIVGAGLAAGMGALAPIGAGVANAMEVSTDADRLADTAGLLHRADFAALLGQRFDLLAPGRISQVLTLAAVLDPKPHRARVGARRYAQPRLESFSVVFRGMGRSLPQGTYALSHPRLGRFSLFMVPGARTAGAQSYTAAFNRLLG